MFELSELSQKPAYLKLFIASYLSFKGHFNQNHLSTIKSYFNQDYQINNAILKIITRVTQTKIINCKSSIKNYHQKSP